MSTIRKLSNVTAAILVGGYGTRLRSVVVNSPKALAEVRGKPFLSFLLDKLVEADIRDVVLCTGYLGEQIEARFRNSYNNLRLVYSRELLPLGTAGALRFAKSLFQSDSVLVMNGDSYFDVDLKAFWAWYCYHEANAAITLTLVPDTKRYGRINVDSEGCILHFEEKGGFDGPGWINAGIYLLKQDLLQEISASRMVSLEREVFPAWIGHSFCGYQSSGRFIDIGTPESYSEADQFFA